MLNVSERALVGRINRVLAKQHKSLRLCRKDTRSFDTLGRYYVIDIGQRGGIVDYKLDLEWLARDLNVMGESERLSA